MNEKIKFPFHGYSHIPITSIRLAVILYKIKRSLRLLVIPKFIKIIMTGPEITLRIPAIKFPSKTFPGAGSSKIP